MAVLSRSYLKDNAAPALDIIGINRYFRFVSNLFQFLIKGMILSEGTDVIVITPNRPTFFFPETENLNFGD